jgi:tetratricopeptide (TPR) repeat protein
MSKSYNLCSARKKMDRMTRHSIFLMTMLCAGISVLPFYSRADEALGFFASGNREYEKGDYASAVAEYEKARLTGEVSAALYYNLGGAYFRSGDIGRAVLNYERALGLDPRDPDIAANYAFAKSMVTGKQPPAGGFFSWRPLRAYYRFFTVNEMAVASSVLFFLFFAFLGISIASEVFRRRARFIAVFLAVLVIFSSVFMFRKAEHLNSYAVVVVPSSDVLFAPFGSATKFFTLHEGNGVAILESKGSWHRVRRPDGMSGWVNSGDIERI